MKKQSILILFCLIFAGTQQAFARVSVGKAEKLKVVHEFPNTEDYMSNPGRYMDLGILYETFDIVGMPMWVTKDPIFIGLENHNTTIYFEIDTITIDELIAEHQLNKEELVALTFFDKHLGLIVVAGVIGVFFLYNKLTRKDDDVIEIIEEEEGDSKTQNT